MILYHTSQVEIPVPDIHHGRVNADFGQRFYLTPDYDFTYRWAWQDAVVGRYELDLEGLRVHTFSRATEWFEYIFQNRRAKDMLDADVVIGPVANDTIFDTLGIISSGYLTSEEALQLLMIGPEYTQVAVKTQKAADQLKWIGADTVAGGPKMPHCSEAWDAISRYIYTGLQGGSIMKNWMKEENTMICCCSDGTRPVIFKIERIDYE